MLHIFTEDSKKPCTNIAAFTDGSKVYISRVIAFVNGEKKTIWAYTPPGPSYLLTNATFTGISPTTNEFTVFADTTSDRAGENCYRHAWWPNVSSSTSNTKKLIFTLDLTNRDELTFFFKAQKSSPMTGSVKIYIDSVQKYTKNPKTNTSTKPQPTSAQTDNEAVIDTSSYTGTHTIEFRSKGSTQSVGGFMCYLYDIY